MPDTVSFIGGMNVPARFWRLNATVPMAQLDINALSLHLRPRLFASWMFSDYEVPLAQITAAFRLSGQVLRAGIGFTLEDGTTGYFWTWSQQDAVLRELSDRGVYVDPRPRPARALMAAGGGTSATRLPGFTSRLGALTPLFLLASVGVLAILLSHTDSWPFRSFLVAVWILSVATTIPMTRKDRNRGPQ